MAVWIGILIGCLVAWAATKVGFFDMLAILFNIIISVYLAIFLGPNIAGLFGLGEAGYSTAIALIAVGGGLFAVLYGITFLAITGQFKISLPKVLDMSLGGITGFLTGVLIWSFVVLVICAAPISKEKFVKSMGFDQDKLSFSYISFWGDCVNLFAGSSDSNKGTKDLVTAILAQTPENTVVGGGGTGDPGTTAIPPDTNTPVVVEPKPESLGPPPPEINLDELYN